MLPGHINFPVSIGVGDDGHYRGCMVMEICDLGGVFEKIRSHRTTPPAIYPRSHYIRPLLANTPIGLGGLAPDQGHPQHHPQCAVPLVAHGHCH
jgi:hypothetical protein